MRYLLAFNLLILALASHAQTSQKLWSENDRKFLLENLKRSGEQLVKETENLTEAQWDFKESPDRWSIRQVVEHISIWELLLQREISLAYAAGPKPDMVATATHDSVNLKFLKDSVPHIATEYTKPFTYSVPMGVTSGKDNLSWLLKMRT